MKKVLLLLALFLIFILTGCKSTKDKDILKEITQKIDNINSYYLSGEMSLINNETTYKYDVKVYYTKENHFKVSLLNQSNNHEQIILRNDEGVFIVTPKLNKSFKFQSEWPYNNSQSYLLQTIVKDLNSDENVKYEIKDNNYIYTSKVNYSNNKDLEKQNVIISENGEIKEVDVLDTNGIIKIKMIIKEIEFNASINEEIYNLEKNVGVVDNSNDEVSKIEDINYPLYIPTNTTLSSQDKLKTQNGERVILTFSGEKPFTLIEENAQIEKDFKTISSNGDLVMLGDSIGIMDESSLSWYANNREYYISSTSLNSEEIIEVANSISSIPLIK